MGVGKLSSHCSSERPTRTVLGVRTPLASERSREGRLDLFERFGAVEIVNEVRQGSEEASELLHHRRDDVLLKDPGRVNHFVQEFWSYPVSVDTCSLGREGLLLVSVFVVDRAEHVEA